MGSRGVSFLAVVLTPLALAAQVPPFTGEIQVNAYTTGSQNVPAVASAGDGSFVVVWESDAQDGSKFGVFGQLFDSSGAKAGAEFPANTYTTGTQGNPAVASAPNGDFIVVWQTVLLAAEGGPRDHIYGQRFHASAAGPTKVGSEFQVNAETTTSHQLTASVGTDALGNFVVVWLNSDAFQYEVFGQRFDASGAKVGAQFQVNTYTTGDRSRPRIAVAPDGKFVVVWHGYGTGGQYGVFGQRFFASGARSGGEFPVNTFTSGIERYPAVGMDRSGNFVVAWEGTNQDGSAVGIFAQRFSAGGEKVGGEFQVNTYTTSYQDLASLAVGPSGDFLVSWTSAGEDGSLDGIFGQRFDRRGQPIGGEFPINTHTFQRQGSSAVASDGGGFVVAWDSYFQEGSSYGVFARRQYLRPETLAVDPQKNDLSSDGNGVLEPGESVLVEPSWSNRSAGFVAMNGSTPLTFCLIGAPCVAPVDLAAEYGSIPPGGVGNCNDGSPGFCYQVSASGPRPATHWDGGFLENLDVGGSQFWNLHVGDSFSDVPRTEPFYRKIETLLHNGITTGCSTTQYCPATVVSRDAMAIFVAKGIAGLGELVPSAGTVGAAPYDCSPGGHSLFTDVAPTASFCKHVHYLAAQNVTLGCNATQYCPGQTITRDAMASFIAKAVVAPGGGNAVPASYSDPTTSRSYSCVAGSPNLHFTDVPVSSAFCKHIHYLWAKGIVDGCTATTYCPGAPVARDAMAKFIANGFKLQLYGP